MDVGVNIRKYRKAKKITITDLAFMVGTTREYLSNIENGKKMPSFGMIEKIAVELGVNVSDLINIESEPLSPELRELMLNAKELHPELLKNINEFIKTLKNNYMLINTKIDNKDIKYIVDLNVKPNGLTKEEEQRAYDLIQKLKDSNKKDT